jgi:hypothetical protein
MTGSCHNNGDGADGRDNTAHDGEHDPAGHGAVRGMPHSLHQFLLKALPHRRLGHVAHRVGELAI